MEFNATFLISAVSFIVFIFIMNAILYKPVLEIMEKRAAYIKANKDEADSHKQHAKDLIDDKNKKIADAQRKSRDIVSSKAGALKEEKTKVLNDAKAQAGSYFSEQKQSLAAQKNETMNNMKHDVADLANNLTTKLMGFGVSFEPLSDAEVEEVMKKNV